MGTNSAKCPEWNAAAGHFCSWCAADVFTIWINQPTYRRLEQAHNETKHGYDYSERRHANLLQGLGNRPASLFPSRLAAVCGRLGCTDYVLPRARLPGDRS